MISESTVEPSAGSLRMVRWLPGSWCVLLTVLVLGPALAPGYVLNLDMVFVPRQVPLPWMAGLGGGLPRSVPQDLLVSFVSGPLSGQLLQKAALLAALLLAGYGVDRILRGEGLWVRIAAISLAIWNPFVAERLVLGHWSLLLAYGSMPWILRAVIDVRAGHPGAFARLVLWAALGSITPTGGIVCMLVAVPAILPGAALPARRRLLLVAAFVGLNATWWLPGLLNPAAAVSDPAGASGFALRPESWGGPLLTALGLGGVWNSDVQLATRALPWIPVVALVIAGLAAIGIPRFFDVLAPHLPKDVADVRTQPQPQPQLDREIAQPKTGRWVGGWLLGLATVSLIVVVLGSWGLTSGALRWIVSEVPGGGLLRDSQKLLVFLTLVLALAAPLGAATLARRISAPAALGLSLGTLAMLPLVTMPDLAWGAFGRLGPVDYPDGWNQLRTTIAAGEPGDVTSLPWATFRRYSWNSGRTVLDPMPRYLTRTVVVDDRLPVARGDGIEFVSGDNPRSAALAAELATDRRLADVLPEQGIRWAVVQTDQPGHIPAGRFAGMALVGAWPGLELWQVRRPPLVTSQPNYAWVVYTVDGLVALMLIELAGARLQRLRLRKRIADVSNFRWV